MYQHNKIAQKQSEGLLEPLPIAEYPWENMTAKLITCLVKSYDYGIIMMVMDRFSNYVTFMSASPG